MRISRSGRVLASPPVDLANSVAGGASFFAFQAPVYVMPERLERWQPGTLANTTAGLPVTLLACAVDGTCGVNDTRTRVVAQMQPVDVPLWGTTAELSQRPPEALPLCTPAIEHAGGRDSYDLWWNETRPANSSGAACPTTVRQNLQNKRALVLNPKRMLHVGEYTLGRNLQTKRTLVLNTKRMLHVGALALGPATCSRTLYGTPLQPTVVPVS